MGLAAMENVKDFMPHRAAPLLHTGSVSPDGSTNSITEDGAAGRGGSDSSAVEHAVHIGGVGGSKPSPSTKPRARSRAKHCRPIWQHPDDTRVLSFYEYTEGRLPRFPKPLRFEEEVAYVPLSRGLEAMIDAADAPKVARWHWHATGDRSCGNVYATRGVRVNTKDTQVAMHRVITGAGPGEFVDHKDGNGLNNRRDNLRFATHAQNMQNRKKHRNNTIGATGVTKHRNRFFAKIHHNNKIIC